MTNEEEKVIDTVQVALRIRPLVESEITRGCEMCLECFPSESQVQVKGLAFTYNYVFPPEINQSIFYETAISKMVNKLFKGYNVTILAYGQTGSGKTFSMGTCYDGDDEEVGIIPRAVNDIFYHIDSNAEKFDFKVTVSFMELYQEQLYDLLSNRPREKNIIDIREDHRGILLPGLTEEKVTSAMDTMNCLVRGSAGRATGATAMNAHSSRSHAIFTIQIVKENKEDKNQITTSKFHLVDLAGSERSKKTKATGNRFKEGVKINQGLLALGNVISALGDGTNRGFIAYRESKLTRLLQDSLGGNSMTLMVACVSPADYNLEETVSTLRYADRARQIKNKPIINQDAKGAEIIRLNNLVQQLRVQLLNGGNCASGDGMDLAEQLKKEKVKYAELLHNYETVVEKNKNLNKMLQESMTENTNIFEKVLLAEAAKEKVDRKLAEITEECNQTIDNLSKIEDASHRDVALQSICEMRCKILDIQSEQRHDEKQLIEQLIQEDSANAKVDTEDMSDEYLEASPFVNENDIQAKEEAHALDQYSKGHQLQEIVKSLALKMSLAEKLSASNQGIHAHNQNIKEYEEKIASLELEKDKLMQQLKAIGHKNRDQKTVDRVQGLETEINNLRKKCQQQANFLKMKEKNDLRIVQLNKEIIQMKAARVKLIRTMKQDNTKFQQWKVQNERRIAKLCDQDRKRQNAMVKMEIMHVKQQNVLKRKMEEAVAINKRLKEALDKHKSVQKQRGVQVTKNGDTKSNSDAILLFVEQELEVVSWLVAAQRHLDGLMEDRSDFMEQMEERKACNPNDPQLPHLQEEIKQRSAQIAELQEKILTGDQENKSKSRWEGIQTMADAKSALKYLFEMTTEAKREIQNHRYRNMQEDTKIDELKHLHAEALNKISELEVALQNSEYEHKKEISEIEKQNEEKICTLLLQLNGVDSGTTDDQLIKRVAILEELYNNAIKSKECLVQDIELLRKQLEETNKKTQLKKSKSGNKSKVEKVANTTYTWDDDEEDDDEGSEDDDPDWKATPIARRTFVKSRVPLKDINNETNLGVKRNSDGQTKCSCKGNCGTKLCSCKKFGTSCSGKCKCNKELCANNKDTSDIENQTHTTNTTDEKWEDCEMKSIRYTADPTSESDNSGILSRQNSAEDDVDSFPKKAKKNRSFFYGEGKSEI